MGDLDLPQEDMEFLNKVCGSERTPEFEASLRALEADAASGDEVAKRGLEGILVAELTTDEFRADGQQLMNESVILCAHFLPELIARSDVDATFMSQFAQMLMAIQRSAYTRGWMARGKQETTNES